jgi:hypothetical protein
MFSHLKKNSKVNTKERNTKATLQEQNKWIEIDQLVSITDKDYEATIRIEEKNSMYSFCNAFQCV